MNHKPDIKKSNPCPPCPSSASTFEKCVYWLGIGLGSGLPKKAPGTWGTVGGLIVALPMLLLGFWGFLIITVTGCLLGSYICGKTSELMGVHDDPHIVFDEWVGMWIALLPSVWLMFYFSAENQVGLAYLHPSLALFFIIPFVLFRLFDILKPAPVSWADKHVSGGFGIMLDDILAGVFAGWVTAIVVFAFLPANV